MKTKLRNLLVVALVCALPVIANATDPKIEKKQQDIRDTARQTLQRLYKAEPGAKSAIHGAAGYAVFSNLGVKILVAGSGNGKGIAVNNKTKQETFMKMLEVQAGLGMGVKKFSVIFVFDTANERLCELRLGVRWASYRRCEEWRPRRIDGGSSVGRRRRMDVPTHRQGPRPRNHCQGHQVLQRRRSE